MDTAPPRCATSSVSPTGSTIYAAHSADEVVDVFRRGQGVFGIAVGPVQAEMEGAIHRLFAEGGGPPGGVAAPRAARPDAARPGPGAPRRVRSVPGRAPYPGSGTRHQPRRVRGRLTLGGAGNAPV